MYRKIESLFQWTPYTYHQDSTINILLYLFCVLVAQSCLTLCNPMDYRLPGSSVHGILQVRILEWVAIPFSRGSLQSRDRTKVSRIAGRFLTGWAIREVKVLVSQLCLILCDPMAGAHQAPLSMEFSRQEYWSGLPFPFPGCLPNPEIEPGFPALQADSLLFVSPGKPRKVRSILKYLGHSKERR